MKVGLCYKTLYIIHSFKIFSLLYPFSLSVQDSPCLQIPPLVLLPPLYPLFLAYRKEVEAPYLSRRSGTTQGCESPAKETQGA